MDTQTENRADRDKHNIHIVVEVVGKKKPVTFDHTPVTGAEIRAKAGARPTTRAPDPRQAVGRQHRARGQVDIKSGDLFIALPTER
jgi:hypothetical protein